MYLKGVNYFNGWHRNAGNKWETQGVDWRKDYSERIPLWGMFNGKDTMQAEIDVAASYGVDFFKMLWYVMTPPREVGCERLNNCFDDFLNCPNNDKMKFCLEFCNHDPFGIDNEETWKESVHTWVEYMKHPSYLRVNGKAVISFLWVHFFFVHCGSSYDTAKSWIDYLRETARKEGVGEILIGAGLIMPHVIQETSGQILHLFDFTTCYNSIPADELEKCNLNNGDSLIPYELLEDYVAKKWERVQTTIDLPYVPHVVAGWNPAPWYPKKIGHFFEMPTREQWRHTMELTKSYLEQHPESHIDKDVKMFTMYAWNEYGEGGIIAPTVGEGYMKLEEIRDVFKEQ